MHAIELIEQDHRLFRYLFQEYERTGDDGAARQRVADRLFRELAAHETMEEEVLYPALRENVSSDSEDSIKEGIEEHHVADLLVVELADLTPEHEAFDPKFTVLRENVEHHLQEEEDMILPMAKNVFPVERLEEMGAQMESVKRELLDDGF